LLRKWNASGAGVFQGAGASSVQRC